MYCTRMRAKSREAALFPSSFLLPSHAEAEGLLGIGLHCHGVGDTQVDHRRWLLLQPPPPLLLLLPPLLLPMRFIFLSP